jgi:tRNA pseudouridine55 synthase
MPQVDGFLNICKPLGWTSHDVVGFVRRRIGQQRVGHAGTLDPAATGVLPLCLGRATRLADRVAAGSKLYAADVRLGLGTDTCDAEGRVLAASDVSAADGLTLAAIVQALSSLLGDQRQAPPSYAALKVDGEAAYVRARRGETVVLPARPVVVYGIGALAWRAPRLSLVVRCSKGTYVRALARDLGTALGCEGHLDALVRLAVGPFTLHDAVTLEDLEEQSVGGRWAQLVVPPDCALVQLPAGVLDSETARNFAFGRAWVPAAGSVPQDARAYDLHGRLLGLLRRAESPARWQPALSFVYDPGVDNEC